MANLLSSFRCHRHQHTYQRSAHRNNTKPLLLVAETPPPTATMVRSFLQPPGPHPCPQLAAVLRVCSSLLLVSFLIFQESIFGNLNSSAFYSSSPLLLFLDGRHGLNNRYLPTRSNHQQSHHGGDAYLSSSSCSSDPPQQQESGETKGEQRRSLSDSVNFSDSTSDSDRPHFLSSLPSLSSLFAQTCGVTYALAAEIVVCTPDTAEAAFAYRIQLPDTFNANRCTITGGQWTFDFATNFNGNYGTSSPTATLSLTNNVISGGANGVGALYIQLPSTVAIAATKSPFAIFVKNTRFLQDSIFRLEGNLPPKSTFELSGNTFSITSTNIFTMTSSLFAFYFGDGSTSDFRLIENSQFTVSDNVVTAQKSTSLNSQPKMNFNTFVANFRSCVITGGSAMRFMRNVVTARNFHSLCVVSFDAESSLSIESSSVLQIDGNVATGNVLTNGTYIAQLQTKTADTTVKIGSAMSVRNNTILNTQCAFRMSILEIGAKTRFDVLSASSFLFDRNRIDGNSVDGDLLLLFLEAPTSLIDGTASVVSLQSNYVGTVAVPENDGWTNVAQIQIGNQLTVSNQAIFTVSSNTVERQSATISGHSSQDMLIQLQTRILSVTTSASLLIDLNRIVDSYAANMLFIANIRPTTSLTVDQSATVSVSSNVILSSQGFAGGLNVLLVYTPKMQVGSRGAFVVKNNSVILSESQTDILMVFFQIDSAAAGLQITNTLSASSPTSAASSTVTISENTIAGAYSAEGLIMVAYLSIATVSISNDKTLLNISKNVVTAGTESGSSLIVGAYMDTPSGMIVGISGRLTLEGNSIGGPIPAEVAATITRLSLSSSSPSAAAALTSLLNPSSSPYPQALASQSSLTVLYLYWHVLALNGDGSYVSIAGNTIQNSEAFDTLTAVSIAVDTGMTLSGSTTTAYGIIQIGQNSQIFIENNAIAGSASLAAGATTVLIEVDLTVGGGISGNTLLSISNNSLSSSIVGANSVGTALSFAMGKVLLGAITTTTSSPSGRILINNNSVFNIGGGNFKGKSAASIPLADSYQVVSFNVRRLASSGSSTTQASIISIIAGFGSAIRVDGNQMKNVSLSAAQIKTGVSAVTIAFFSNIVPNVLQLANGAEISASSNTMEKVFVTSSAGGFVCVNITGNVPNPTAATSAALLMTGTSSRVTIDENKLISAAFRTASNRGFVYFSAPTSIADGGKGNSGTAATLSPFSFSAISMSGNVAFGAVVTMNGGGSSASASSPLYGIVMDKKVFGVTKKSSTTTASEFGKDKMNQIIIKNNAMHVRTINAGTTTTSGGGGPSYLNCPPVGLGILGDVIGTATATPSNAATATVPMEDNRLGIEISSNFLNLTMAQAISTAAATPPPQCPSVELGSFSGYLSGYIVNNTIMTDGVGSVYMRELKIPTYAPLSSSSSISSESSLAPAVNGLSLLRNTLLQRLPPAVRADMNTPIEAVSAFPRYMGAVNSFHLILSVFSIGNYGMYIAEENNVLVSFYAQGSGDGGGSGGSAALVVPSSSSSLALRPASFFFPSTTSLARVPTSAMAVVRPAHTFIAFLPNAGASSPSTSVGLIFSTFALVSVCSNSIWGRLITRPLTILDSFMGSKPQIVRFCGDDEISKTIVISRTLTLDPPDPSTTTTTTIIPTTTSTTMGTSTTTSTTTTTMTAPPTTSVATTTAATSTTPLSPTTPMPATTTTTSTLVVTTTAATATTSASLPPTTLTSATTTAVTTAPTTMAPTTVPVTTISTALPTSAPITTPAATTTTIAPATTATSTTTSSPSPTAPPPTTAMPTTPSSSSAPQPTPSPSPPAETIIINRVSPFNPIENALFAAAANEGHGKITSIWLKMRRCKRLEALIAPRALLTPILLTTSDALPTATTDGNTSSSSASLSSNDNGERQGGGGGDKFYTYGDALLTSLISLGVLWAFCMISFIVALIAMAVMNSCNKKNKNPIIGLRNRTALVSAIYFVKFPATAIQSLVFVANGAAVSAGMILGEMAVLKENSDNGGTAASTNLILAVVAVALFLTVLPSLLCCVVEKATPSDSRGVAIADPAEDERRRSGKKRGYGGSDDDEDGLLVANQKYAANSSSFSSGFELRCGGVRPMIEAKLLGPCVGDFGPRVHHTAVIRRIAPLVPFIIPIVLFVTSLIVASTTVAAEGNGGSVVDGSSHDDGSGDDDGCRVILLVSGIIYIVYAVIVAISQPFLGMTHNAVEAVASLGAGVCLIGLWSAYDPDGGAASSAELGWLLGATSISNARYPFIVARLLDVVLPPVMAVRRLPRIEDNDDGGYGRKSKRSPSEKSNEEGPSGRDNDDAKAPPRASPYKTATASSAAVGVGHSVVVIEDSSAPPHVTSTSNSDGNRRKKGTGTSNPNNTIIHDSENNAALDDPLLFPAAPPSSLVVSTNPSPPSRRNASTVKRKQSSSPSSYPASASLPEVVRDGEASNDVLLLRAPLIEYSGSDGSDADGNVNTIATTTKRPQRKSLLLGRGSASKPSSYAAGDASGGIEYGQLSSHPRGNNNSSMNGMSGGNLPSVATMSGYDTHTPVKSLVGAGSSNGITGSNVSGASAAVATEGRRMNAPRDPLLTTRTAASSSFPATIVGGGGSSARPSGSGAGSYSSLPPQHSLYSNNNSVVGGTNEFSNPSSSSHHQSSSLPPNNLYSSSSVLNGAKPLPVATRRKSIHTTSSGNGRNNNSSSNNKPTTLLLQPTAAGNAAKPPRQRRILLDDDE